MTRRKIILTTALGLTLFTGLLPAADTTTAPVAPAAPAAPAPKDDPKCAVCEQKPAPAAPHAPHAARFDRARGPQPDPMAVIAQADRIKDRLAEKLQLTDEQRDKLEHLGRAYRAQQRELAQKHREELRAVLTPEQQKKFEDMKAFRGHGPKAPRVSDNSGPADFADRPAGPLMAALDVMPALPELPSDELPQQPGE